MGIRHSRALEILFCLACSGGIVVLLDRMTFSGGDLIRRGDTHWEATTHTFFKVKEGVNLPPNEEINFQFN
jgi:hypothetical protein